MLRVALATAAGYVAGSVPVGVLVSRAAAGIDIRRYGTGNVGAANVRENLGVLPAAVVALGVFLQGLGPPALTRRLGGSEAAAAGSALGAAAGYGWPLFTGFRGGRGVGVATGAAAGICPGGFVVLLLSYALGAALRQTSPAVLIGFALYAAYVYRATDSAARRAAAVLLLLFIAARRLEGVRDDLEHGPPVPVFLNLLIFQRRPERPGRRRR